MFHTTQRPTFPHFSSIVLHEFFREGGGRLSPKVPGPTGALRVPSTRRPPPCASAALRCVLAPAVSARMAGILPRKVSPPPGSDGKGSKHPS